MSESVLCSALPNGLRLLAIPMPWRNTLSLSVFVRTGSLHEAPTESGISHVVEHMAFKGTATRDCQRINLDAELLGAEVNAHTDKDHTAYHMEGLPKDAGALIAQLADLVMHGSFPAEELDLERGVIEQEFNEFEDDPVTQAFQAFDRACYGDAHAAGRPVIGRRAVLRRLKRRDLLAYVQRQYTASNVIVAAAGPMDAGAFKDLQRHVQRAFASMPAGTPNGLRAPAWQGGLQVKRLSGCGQCQVVLGFEAPGLVAARAGELAHVPHLLAAAVLGEGMSSPLLDELRERRGLAYHAACTADISPLMGQLVIEAATSPEQAAELLETVHGLLREQARAIAPEALARARRQLAVRALRALEQPSRRMESAVQDLFCFGRLRDQAAWMKRLEEVSANEVRQVFVKALKRRPALALAGSVPAKVRSRAEVLFFSPT
ncbi:MAG: insulinase family protein [Paucibacter sp.]|nr:insulinase family protein [Roseateles sp.]